MQNYSSKLKIIFFGSRAFVIPVAQVLKDNFQLEAIVTVPDQPAGRSYKLTPTQVKEAFQGSKIPVYDPPKFKPMIDQFKNYKPDLFVVAAYGKIIPKEVLDLPKYGTINLHPSLLPKYRGPSPIQNTILNGDNKTAMTFMLLDEEMDHGPILFQKDFTLSEQDNFEILGNRMFQESSNDLVQVIKEYVDGKLTPHNQDHSKATYCKMIKKEDGYFEIDNPPSPEVLDRMIRAYYPWPNAWTKWEGKIVKFLPDGMIQMEGKKAVTLKDFLNGYPDFPFKQLLGV